MIIKRNHPFLGLYTIGIAALFLIGFLTLVVFGAGSYRGIVESREENNLDRASLAYITTVTKSADQGAISVGKGPEGDMLVIAEKDTGYETRVYLSDGALKEEYRDAEQKTAPDKASTIVKTDTFTIEDMGKGLLKVTTGEGQVFVFAGEKGGSNE